MMNVRPSGISSWVGYQRPCRMFGWRFQRSLNGSNV